MIILPEKRMVWKGLCHFQPPGLLAGSNPASNLLEHVRPEDNPDQVSGKHVP